MDDTLREFEETALVGCRKVRDFLSGLGDRREGLNMAKVGAAAMGSYSRLRATIANEKAIALAEQRLLPPAPPALNG